ncbi:hypothetical protein [Sphingobacterium sp. DR205]|uniref:hypothetical protein n=1 Tax=Sphingobacterium sp. DR205 TaxID=2713573 RepID=UPI0013E4B22B|nr:hypothetical protein [Sphingobacterium sp. DR205]QIH35580.1 hypothetical protein G6053_23090 [Sphingobacterium sp. DR205]
MKALLLLFNMLIALSTFYKGQNDQRQLIELFYKKIYDLNISPEQIVKDHIIYSDTIGFEHALGSVKSLRQPLSNANEHFSLLKKDIENRDYVISHFDSFGENEKTKFHYLEEKDRTNVYRLSPKNTIEQYILIKGNKIRSFFGVQKTGASGYTFIIY